MVSNVSPAGSAVPFAAPKKTKATSPQFGGSSKTQKAAKTDTYHAAPKAGKNQPKFGGLGKAALGLSTGMVLWPMALLTGMAGILLHPLLPVAAVMAAAPVALGLLGGFWPGKK